ncbi:MAG: hypothetical protein M1833_000002 [Piccolia ochrophora]|nr:MAG: hypothetical protein M1833_000002 [Piccolia ochrophora]
MAPTNSLITLLVKRQDAPPPQNPRARDLTPLDGNILEAWSQGLMVGGLLILVMITVANMRRHVLLHKLILLELFMAMGHGTFIFAHDPFYGKYLSGTAVFLYLSLYLHNIIGWIKNKPFLPPWGSKLYIGTVIMVFPFWVAEMYFNFQYFNNLGDDHFQNTRPWEALLRDPWWIFTTSSLIYVIKNQYNFGLIELVKLSPRFGVLMLSMFLSIAFVLTDVIVTAGKLMPNKGVNPYWKLALIFKCSADALFLDDFRKVLDSLIHRTLSKAGGQVHTAERHARPETAARQNSATQFGVRSVITADKHTGGGGGRKGFRKHFTSQSQSPPPYPIRGEKHTEINVARTHCVPHTNSSGSLTSDESYPPKPDPAHNMPAGRRPTLEWFDAIGPDGPDPVRVRVREDISPGSGSPKAQSRDGPRAKQSWKRESERSIDFITTTNTGPGGPTRGDF